MKKTHQIVRAAVIATAVSAFPGVSSAVPIAYEFSGNNFGPFGSAGEPSIPGLTLSGSFTVDVDQTDGTIIKLLSFSFGFSNPDFLFGTSNYDLSNVVFDSAPAIINPNAGQNIPPKSRIGGSEGGLDPEVIDAGAPGGDFLLRFDHIADPTNAALTAFLITWDENAMANNSGAFFTTTLYGASNLELTQTALTSPVPLPAAFPLFAGGLGLLGLLGWRRKRHAA